MILRIKNILFATDMTKNSAHAFLYALDLSQKYNARIHILHVLEKLSSSEEAQVALWNPYLSHLQLERIREEKRKELIDRITKSLNEIIKKEENEDPEIKNRVVSIMVVDGDPADEILKKSEELNSDVIVMGTHGKGLIAHTFLGSVSEKVLHRTRKPVFIIPLPKEEIDIPFLI